MHTGIFRALKPTCWNLIPYSQHREQNGTSRGHWHQEVPGKLLRLASSKASFIWLPSDSALSENQIPFQPGHLSFICIVYFKTAPLWGERGLGRNPVISHVTLGKLLDCSEAGSSFTYKQNQRKKKTARNKTWVEMWKARLSSLFSSIVYSYTYKLMCTHTPPLNRF